MWSYANADLIVREYLKQFPKRDFYDALSEQFTNRSIESIRGGMQVSELPPMPAKPKELVTKKSLEHVVQRFPENGRGMPQILGYADLLISWSNRSVSWSPEHQKWYVNSLERKLLVEAKTKLPSLGDLMRQINIYRQVYEEVVVVAPDDSFADILTEQGVLFVPYKVPTAKQG